MWTREPHRRYKSELRSTQHQSPHRTIEAPCSPRSREGDRTNAAFMPPGNMKILGEGRPRWPRRRGNAEGQPVERDRATDVARQHDIGRPQGNKNSGGLNPAPGEHTRRVVAGYTGPLLFLFEQTHNYYVDNCLSGELGFWFLVCYAATHTHTHTASNSITTEMHTSGAQ